MQFTEQQLDALRMLVLGKSRAQVARVLQMTDTTFSRFMKRVYLEAGTRNTLETAVKLTLSGHLGLTLEDFPDRRA